MANVTIEVNYNVNTHTATYTMNGKVTNGDVTVEYGDNSITWQAAGNAGRWKFTGIDITPAHPNISSVPSDNAIVVNDNDKNDTGQDKVYNYCLAVQEIQTGNTKRLDPQIINKTRPVHS